MRLTHSATQRALCVYKKTISASRMNRTKPDLLVANWPPMLPLMWGVGFAFVFSVHLYVECRKVHSLASRWCDCYPALQLYQDPHTLTTFFWRSAHLDCRHQAYEPSVSVTLEDIRQNRHVEGRLRDA